MEGFGLEIDYKYTNGKFITTVQNNILYKKSAIFSHLKVFRLRCNTFMFPLSVLDVKVNAKRFGGKPDNFYSKMTEGGFSFLQV